MYVEKGKTEERYTFDVLFICQRISTSRFCLNPKIFLQNYFCMRNNDDRFFFYSVGSLHQGLKMLL